MEAPYGVAGRQGGAVHGLVRRVHAVVQAKHVLAQGVALAVGEGQAAAEIAGHRGEQAAAAHAAEGEGGDAPQSGAAAFGKGAVGALGQDGDVETVGGEAPGELGGVVDGAAEAFEFSYDDAGFYHIWGKKPLGLKATLPDDGVSCVRGRDRSQVPSSPSLVGTCDPASLLRPGGLAAPAFDPWRKA